MKEIIESGELLGPSGQPLHKGWSRSMLLSYHRSEVPAWRRLFRLKEWDTCVFGNDDLQVCITIADCGYAGAVTVSVVSLLRRTEMTRTVILPLTFGGMEMTETPDYGDIIFRGKGLSLDLARSPGKRYIRFRMEHFDDVKPLYVNVNLTQSEGDSLCTAAAYPETAGGFCLSQRLLAMPASGVVVYGADRFELESGCMGSYYWGRGVLPRSTSRQWLMGCGNIAGRRIGICVGDDAGFVCVDGKGTRFAPTSIRGIQGLRESNDPSMPVVLRSTDDALNLTLEGAVRCSQSRGLPLLVSVERGLTFGRCSGSVLLDSGERLQIEGMNAMLCDIQAVW